MSDLIISRRSFLLQAGTVALGFTLAANQCEGTKKTLIRFGLVTDSHYADRPVGGTRYYRESLTKMQECIATFNREKVDFVIHLGDFKDQDADADPKRTLTFLKALEAEYAKFAGPRYHCVGNHDVDSITKKQFLANIENTGIARADSYYEFTKNGFQFIVLDANYHPDGRHHFYLEGADWQDIRIPQEQLIWLDEVLKSSQLPAVVFCHHPTFRYLHDGNTYHIRNYSEVQPMLEGSGRVMAVFHGHTHRDTYETIRGIHYLTLLGMVDHSGPENNAYAIAEIYGDGRIELIGYRRIENRNL